MQALAADGRRTVWQRILNGSGVRLDPHDDEQFEWACQLSAHALLLDGNDARGRNIYSATDEGGLWIELTDGQYAKLSSLLNAHGIEIEHALRPARKRGQVQHGSTATTPSEPGSQ